MEQTPAPSTKSEVTATPNVHRRHTTASSSSDTHTPSHPGVASTDRGNSAPGNLHSSRGLATPVERENRERLSVTPNLPDHCGRVRTNVGRTHPLVTTTRSVGQDKNEPCAAKRSQDQPPPPTHRDTTPPYSVPTKPVTSKKSSDSTPKTSEIETESATETVSGSDVSSSGAEEARKRRQEQQRLQKEKWQKRYGLGAKRESDSDLNSEEEGFGGVAAVAIDNDDLISAGGLYTLHKPMIGH